MLFYNQRSSAALKSTWTKKQKQLLDISLGDISTEIIHIKKNTKHSFNEIIMISRELNIWSRKKLDCNLLR